MKSGRKMKSLFQAAKINQTAGDILPDSPPAIIIDCIIFSICARLVQRRLTRWTNCVFIFRHIEFGLLCVCWLVAMEYEVCRLKCRVYFLALARASCFSCTSTGCLYFALYACAELQHEPSPSTSQMEWKRDSPQGEPHLARPIGGLLRGRPGESSPVFTCSCGGRRFLSR